MVLVQCVFDVNVLFRSNSLPNSDGALHLYEETCYRFFVNISFFSISRVRISEIESRVIRFLLQELFSNKLKEVRVDLIEARALQVAASQLPSSSDPLVGQLCTLVQNQTNVIAGLSFVVSREPNSVICLFFFSLFHRFHSYNWTYQLRYFTAGQRSWILSNLFVTLYFYANYLALISIFSIFGFHHSFTHYCLVMVTSMTRLLYLTLFVKQCSLINT